MGVWSGVFYAFFLKLTAPNYNMMGHTGKFVRSPMALTYGSLGGVKHTTPRPNTMRPGEVQLVQKIPFMSHFVRVTPSLRIQNSHEIAYWGSFL